MSISGRLWRPLPHRWWRWPSVSRRRNLGKVVRELQRKEQWRQERAGSLSLIAFDAADVRTAVSEMAERGIYCYD